MQIKRPLYGIIGGMGPVCSAEFVNYVYSKCLGKYESEREYPRLIVISDSTAPDRLTSYSNDNFRVLKDYIEDVLKKLDALNVDKIMICCLVAHACLAKIDSKLTKNIINLIDLLNHEIGIKKAILLSTEMFYELKLLANEKVVILPEDDRRLLNNFISKIKTSPIQEIYHDFINFVEKLLERYGLNTIALACSDLHRINQFIKLNNLNINFEIIDAMELAANHILKDHIGAQFFV